MSSYTRAGFILGITLLTTVGAILIQQVYAFNATWGFSRKASIATSGDNNVYVVWPSNKTGNGEIMFRASTGGGKTFGNKTT